MTESRSAPWKAKLTAEQVMELRAAYLSGETDYAALGRRYGIAASTVRQVATGRSWKHLPYDTRPGNYPAGDRHWTHKQPERVARGEEHPNSRLTEETVLEIRRSFANREMSMRKMALQWGVTLQTIRMIVGRQTWKHLPFESGEQTCDPLTKLEGDL